MKPRDAATRSRELRDLRRLDPDGFLRKTFTLPVEEARAQARTFIREFPSGGYMTIVDGGVSFPTDKFNSQCDGCLRQIRPIFLETS